jgi:hypothetical protein
MYLQKPFDYEIFTLKSPERRERFHVGQPTGIHKDDLQASSLENR